MTGDLAISPWQALAHLADEPDFPFLDDLDWAILECDPEFVLRYDQHPELLDSARYVGYLGGRGLGKSYAVSKLITRDIDEGRIKSLALLAQNEDKSIELQVRPLLAAASPWNPAIEFKGNLVWANGAMATIYTPESPGVPRGFNGDAAWLSELVAWPEPTREEAFKNIITATRVGRARIWWDTTAKGVNELIDYMFQLNELDPVAYRIIRGHMCDNPLLSRAYLREQFMLYTGRQFEEEVEGKVFSEAQGALFRRADIDNNRVTATPASGFTLLAWDPGTSNGANTDADGLIRATRVKGRYYVERDWSGHLTTDQATEIILDECLARGNQCAAGVVVETNKGGEKITHAIRAAAIVRSLRNPNKPPIEVRVMASGDRWPTARTPNVIYVREVFSRNDKMTRAEGPAGLCGNGLVSHVGTFPDLERQLCSYAGNGRSPNNFDAYNAVITELAELNQTRQVAAVQQQARDLPKAGENLRSRLKAFTASRRVL